MTEKYPNAPDCPFCRSSDLSDTDWWDDDGEFDAIECNECKGSAPADVWCGNTRPKSEAEELLEWLHERRGSLQCYAASSCVVDYPDSDYVTECDTAMDALRAAREASDE